MKKTLYLLCTFSLAIFYCTAQETSQPVANKSNRIILHFNDTTGLFTQLAKLFIDAGYDIEMKDRELGILRVKKLTMNELTIRTIFRDSTITLSGTARSNEFYYELVYNKWIANIKFSAWKEMLQIANLLKPHSITYGQIEKPAAFFYGL